MDLIRISGTYSNPHMCQSHDLPYPRSASRIGNPFLQSRWPKAHAWERLLWIPFVSWTIMNHNWLEKWQECFIMYMNVYECMTCICQRMEKNKMNQAGSKGRIWGKPHSWGFHVFILRGVGNLKPFHERPHQHPSRLGIPNFPASCEGSVWQSEPTKLIYFG